MREQGEGKQRAPNWYFSIGVAVAFAVVVVVGGGVKRTGSDSSSGSILGNKLLAKQAKIRPTKIDMRGNKKPTELMQMPGCISFDEYGCYGVKKLHRRSRTYVDFSPHDPYRAIEPLAGTLGPLEDKYGPSSCVRGADDR
mmetsp:Transcript_20408/g.50023  ORF Transcript_20408/g.50023 Transcript_20408/m.50023 type:complete len:140 (+) Transcript_20408:557-976(+)